MNARTIKASRTLDSTGGSTLAPASNRLSTSLRLVILGLASSLVGIGAGLGLEPWTAAAARSPQEAPAAQTKTEKKPTKTVAIPPKAVVAFEMLPTNHMLVEARINDKGPYRLIFDLGAPVTLLNNRVSEAAGVVKPSAPRSFLFGMRGEAEVNKLKVGELTAEKLPVIVLDHPVLKALEDMTDRRIDGIMGFTFFARYKTTIDYHSHQMTFEPIDYQIRDLLKELPDRLMGPKVARHRVLAPSGIWGLRLGGEPLGGLDLTGCTGRQSLRGIAGCPERSQTRRRADHGRWPLDDLDCRTSTTLRPRSSQAARSPSWSTATARKSPWWSLPRMELDGLSGKALFGPGAGRRSCGQ